MGSDGYLTLWIEIKKLIKCKRCILKMEEQPKKLVNKTVVLKKSAKRPEIVFFFSDEELQI